MVMSLIIPNLYMGSYEDACDLISLSAVNIKGIVSIGCSTDADVDSNVYERLSYKDILDKPEQPILHLLGESCAFINRFLKKNTAVLVHCVYGQSRSAAVIASYLLSEGVQVDDAVQLIKERRPVTCINPGFLAQLFLLSKKKNHSAQIQLVVRGIVKCRGLNSFQTDTIGSIEKLSEAVSLEYIDCYKPVLISSNGHECGLNSGVDNGSRDDIKCDSRIDMSISEKDHSALGHEQLQRQGQETISTAHDGIHGMKNTSPQIDTTDSVECGKCGHVLACDSDIVRAIDYSEFLSSTTDDYWVGYTAIHPTGGRAMRLENCNKLKRKDVNLNGKSVVITASKKRSNESKSNIILKDSREQLAADEVDLDIQDFVILGPMVWILSQLAEVDENNAKMYATFEGGEAGSGSGPVKNRASQCKMKRPDTSSIRCPNCDQICGCYKESGLDLCNSFVRCELFALHRSKINVKVIKLPLITDNTEFHIRTTNAAHRS